MAKFKLIDIMPSSISGDKKVQAICEVLDPYLEVLWEQIDNISIYKNIDKLDHEKLDHLAYQFHVDYYHTNWSAEKKRLAIKNSIAWHRYKGTPWAVEHLLSTFFGEAYVREWFEYGGDPYYFRINVKNFLGSGVPLEEFIEALYEIKNTRSWLEGLTTEHEQNIYVGAYGTSGHFIHSYPNEAEDMENEQNIYVAAFNIYNKLEVKSKAALNRYRDKDGDVWYYSQRTKDGDII